MLCGPSQAQVVTQLSSALSPRVVWKGGQGEASSRSVAQNANLAGVPWVARSPRPGVAPAIFSCTNRTARPIVALDGNAGPKQPDPPCIPAARAAGPDARMNTAHGCVVALIPSRLNGGCEIASTAASTIGNCCRPATGHYRIDRDALHRRLALSGREHAKHFQRDTAGTRDHRIDPFAGRGNQWKTIRPARDGCTSWEKSNGSDGNVNRFGLAAANRRHDPPA